MDWDGVGTFALFLSSGAIGLGLIALKAYKARLASRLEWERLRRFDSAPDEATQEQLAALESQVHRLTERMDFSERLLSERGTGVASEAPASEAPAAEG